MTTINNISINQAITLLNFYKIIKDLINDLYTSFGDKISAKIANNCDYQTIINYKLPNYSDDINVDEYVNSIELSTIAPDFFNSLNTIYEYCKGTFALRSIDILYQNEDIFLNKSNVENSDTLINTVFLPDIDFADLYYDDTSTKTKQTLWKYLQVILFNIITSIDDVSFFGNSLELLKIIDSNKFSSKLESTIDELSKMFSFKEKKERKNANKNKDKNKDKNKNKNKNKNKDVNDGDDEKEDNKEDNKEDEKEYDKEYDKEDDKEDEEDEDEDDDNEDDDNDDEEDDETSSNKESKKTPMFPNIDLTKMFDISINNMGMGNMSGLFDEMLNDLSSNFNNANASTKEQTETNNDYAIPDKDELFSHINKLINGKIGSLAKEIAEETTKDIDMEAIGNINDVNDVLKGFMKDPSKLLGLINNINNKISSKMKDGSLKESELLEEAASIFKNMKNMPGMNNFSDILKSMNLDKMMPKGGKINPNAFQNMMEQNVKMSKMRERMKKKAESSTSKPTYSTSQNSESKTASHNVKLDDLTANLSSLMKDMDNNTSFIDSLLKNQANHSNQSTPRANDINSKRRENNKKKVNRKK